jgi:hypothetical protein
MSPDSRNTLKTLLHPYIFVLKEGRKINNDYLDYSLMMLHINSTETIKSPKTKLKVSNTYSTIDQEIFKRL